MAASVSMAKARVRKSPRLECAELLILRAHVGGDAHLAGRGGEVVVPQQRQLLVERLLDGDHAVDPPARQCGRLFGELAVVLLSRRLGGLPTGPRRRGLQLRHRGGQRAGVGVGICGQRTVEVRRQVLARHRVDLRTVAPKPARRSTRAVVIHCDDCMGPLSPPQLRMS